MIGGPLLQPRKPAAPRAGGRPVVTEVDTTSKIHISRNPRAQALAQMEKGRFEEMLKARISSPKPKAADGPSSARTQGTSGKAAVPPTKQPETARTGHKDKSSLEEAAAKAPVGKPVEAWEGHSAQEGAKMWASYLTQHEKTEIVQFGTVYYGGQGARKIQAPSARGHNFGYDDNQGDYQLIPKDHVAYRYEIISPLGRGSFGQVVKALDHKTKKTIALKVIRNKKKFHEQAQIEVRILKLLNTSDTSDKYNIVRMVDTFTFRNHKCIAFDLHGMNLYEFMKANKFMPLPMATLRKFASQMLMSASFLWREKIIHCDMKPENIVLKENGKTNIKMIDFGSSCFENERMYTYIQSRFYRAPEVMLGLPYGRQIDMWSIGCILCELATGYPLFPGENEAEQIQCFGEILGHPPVDLVDRAPRRKHFCDGSGKLRVVPNSKRKIRMPGNKSLGQVLKRDEEPHFVDFIKCLLRWDPQTRMTPTEAMRHPWIADCFTLREKTTGREAKKPEAPAPAQQQPQQSFLPQLQAGRRRY